MSKDVKVLLVRKEAVGGYSFAASVTEYEISEANLKKHGKLVSKTEPDVFGTVMANLERKAREILGI